MQQPPQPARAWYQNRRGECGGRDDRDRLLNVRDGPHECLDLRGLRFACDAPFDVDDAPLDREVLVAGEVAADGDTAEAFGRFRFPQVFGTFAGPWFPEIAAELHHWQVLPSGTLGWNKAEVTLGGVDTRDLNGGVKKWEWIKKGVPVRVEIG